MTEKQTTIPTKKLSKNKLIRLKQIYGEEKSTATPESSNAYLKKAGFASLADLLFPAK